MRLSGIGPGGDGGAGAADVASGGRETSEPRARSPRAAAALSPVAGRPARRATTPPRSAGFRRFLARYPRHDYADNAQYWIGECYYDLKQYHAATREFRRVVERYPRGNKVPDAMLKLGFSQLAAGERREGRQVLESLRKTYPKHEAARLAALRLARGDRTSAPKLAAPVQRVAAARGGGPVSAGASRVGALLVLLLGPAQRGGPTVRKTPRPSSGARWPA